MGNCIQTYKTEYYAEVSAKQELQVKYDALDASMKKQTAILTKMTEEKLVISVEPPVVEPPVDKQPANEQQANTASDNGDVLSLLQLTRTVSATQVNKLMTMTEDDMDEIEETDYVNMEMVVRLVDIYDGDTFTCLFWDPYMKRYNKKRCRSNGIDAPEMKPPKNMEHRDRWIRYANEAKEALTKWANEPNCIYICRTEHKREKFGRLLVEIYKYYLTQQGDVKQRRLRTAESIYLMKDFEDVIDESEPMSKFMLANTKSRPYDGGKKEDW